MAYFLKKPTRISQLNGSEVCTILVAYHHSGYKCFEYYYRNSILVTYKSCFPQAPSYESFLRYIEKASPMIYLWLFYSVSKSEKTGLYFIDSLLGDLAQTDNKQFINWKYVWNS